MIIHVYAVCHNEELMLPYFLRHYGGFSQKVIIFDDLSTDRSREIITGHPNAVVVPFRQVVPQYDGMFDELVLTRIRNEEYKVSRGTADWVIVIDIDEFLYHPDIRTLLTEYARDGVTLPQTRGFEMVSDHPPSGSGQIYDHLRLGFENPAYSKRAVFHPSLDIRYSAGSHSCNPSGEVKTSALADLKVLHYRFLGEEYFLQRYQLRQQRMSEQTVKTGMGTSLLVPGGNGRVKIFPASREDLKTVYSNVLTGRPIEEVL